MNAMTPAQLTDRVVEAFGSTPDPRLRELISALIRHLHAFATETALTPEEWLAGLRFLTATGQKCDKRRQEFVLLSDVLGLGILAAFFVAPYARHYDFPVLVVPFLILLGGRLSQLAGAGLLIALILGPYVQFYVLGQVKAAHGDDARFLHECSFFWMPLLLAGAWLVTGRGPRTQPALALAERGGKQ